MFKVETRLRWFTAAISEQRLPTPFLQEFGGRPATWRLPCALAARTHGQPVAHFTHRPTKERDVPAAGRRRLRVPGPVMRRDSSCGRRTHAGEAGEGQWHGAAGPRAAQDRKRRCRRGLRLRKACEYCPCLGRLGRRSATWIAEGSPAPNTIRRRTVGEPQANRIRTSGPPDGPEVPQPRGL